MIRAPRLVAAAVLVLALLPLPNQARAGGARQAPAAPRESVRSLIALLRGVAAPHDKARACQELAAIGSKEAVPALEALLSDRELGAYARSGLEAIPDPSADAALRRALRTVRGGLLVGVVNSLGVRRDPAAAGALAGLARGRDADLAAAAIAALGRIGTPASLAVVQGTLVAGAPALVNAAADALLARGDRLAALGRKAEAAALYERVQQAKVPAHVRLAAARRVMVARQAAGLPLLAAHLRSGDPARVAMALRAAREMPGPGVTRTLAAVLPKAEPRLQVSLVQALLDRGDPGVRPAIEALARTGATDVRVAALQALGEIGSPSSAPTLIGAIVGARTEPELVTAGAALVRLPAGEPDTAILGALRSAPAAARVALIDVLRSRNAAGTADTLLALAGDPEPTVSQAAFTALAAASRPTDLPTILRLALASKDEAAQEAAVGAVVATCARLPDVGGRGDALAAAFAESKDAAARALLLRMLGELGTYRAYAAVRPALADGDPAVRAAAVGALVDWPDATPAAALLEAAKTSADAGQRSLALRGAIRMAGTLAADGARPPRQVVDWLTQANALVDGDVDAKRVLLSALGGVKGVEGLALARPYLDDPSVAPEAAAAVVRIAGSLTGEAQQMAKPLLEKVASAGANEAVRGQAAALARRIAGDGLELRVPTPTAGEIDVVRLAFQPLFDGKSFAGWEGADSGAFRIENGAIVGGSLGAPVPRNEFLCTTRAYSDFVLRLECRLTNANAGVQIRSQRVPLSAEMCGYQADMDTSGQYWGCLYDESRRGMLVQADQARLRDVVKKDDWNAYEIRCEGPRIRLFVNGVQTADYTETDPAIPLSGLIGLQVHGGPPSEAWYRSIAIAELP